MFTLTAKPRSHYVTHFVYIIKNISHDLHPCAIFTLQAPAAAAQAYSTQSPTQLLPKYYLSLMTAQLLLSYYHYPMTTQHTTQSLAA